MHLGHPVEHLAEQKLRLHQLDRSTTSQKLDVARQFQVASGGDSTERVGITRSVRPHPWTTSFLRKALQHRTNQSFSSITILVNCHSDEHVDRHNDASCLNVAWNVAEGPQIGGIRFQNGDLPLPPNAWASFWPRARHSSLPGKGNQVFLIAVFPRSILPSSWV